MKKILIIFMLLLFSNIANIENINAQNQNVTVCLNNGNVRQYSLTGTLLWQVTPDGTPCNSVDMDTDGNVYLAYLFSNRLIKLDPSGNVIFNVVVQSSFGRDVSVNESKFISFATGNKTVTKLDINGSPLWTFVDTGATFSTMSATEIDNAGNVYVGGERRIIWKLDTNGNVLWDYNLGGSSGDIQGIEVDNSNGDVYIAGPNQILTKLNSNGVFQWQNTNHTGQLYKLSIDENFVYTSSNDRTIRKINKDTGTQVWVNTSHTARVWDVAVDVDGNVYSGSDDNTFRKINSSGSQVFSISLADDVLSVAVTPILSIQYPLQINLSSNFSPFADIVYIRESNVITSSSISDQIIGPNIGFEVTTSQNDITPFVFQYWLDLDDSTIFSNNRTFIINNPTRDYNLQAIYSLPDFIQLSLDSTLPSPPNFNLEVDTIENERVTINQYPFINQVIPEGYNFEVIAPTSQLEVGFYTFDYWWDNINQEVFTTGAIVSLQALENYSLTATYSLPDEYQINLTLESDVGPITFQLGNLTPITGSFISVTVGQGDSWTATGPLNNDFTFQYWTDLDIGNIFNNNRQFTLSNTTRNYRLEAVYFPVFDVNWDTLGGTLIPSQRITLNDTVNQPPNPVRPNSFFDGWVNLADSLPRPKITFPFTVIENVTFQAIWLNTFTLTFDTNGGQAVPIETIIENNLPTVVTPSRFGYTFDGWFTDNITFVNPFDFNEPFTANRTIYAKWIFGTDRDVNTSFNQFLEDSSLDDPFSQWIIVLAVFIILNVLVFIYSGPMIVTIILNFILTAIFIIIGFIPIWITIIIFLSIFGYMILTLSGGRS